MVHGTLRGGIALTILLSACASAPRGGRDSEQLLVHVENNLTPAAAVWIWLVTADGRVQSLGGTEPECTKLWRLVHDGTSEHFQFVARTSSELTIVSPPFEVGRSEVVQWDIAVNSVTTSAGRKGGPLDALRPPRGRIAGAADAPTETRPPAALPGGIAGRAR